MSISRCEQLKAQRIRARGGSEALRSVRKVRAASRVFFGHLGEGPAAKHAQVADERHPVGAGSPLFDVWARARVDELLSALHERLVVGAS